MQSENREQDRRRLNGLTRKAAIQSFVCHSCGHVFSPEDGDPSQLPLFPDCEGQCLVTAALICADRPAEDDMLGDEDGEEPERAAPVRRHPQF